MEVDLEAWGLTEIIRLRESISEVLVRRFERSLALAFTDVVGSTAYFADFGDEAGRGLMQRHFDLLAAVLPAHGGRIVDTAGDGAFLCFPSADDAVEAISEVQLLILDQNLSRPSPHHLAIRAGVHFGPVLTDGAVVTGDAVNTCARVTSTSGAGEVRITKAAFLALSSRQRARCTHLPPVELKGLARPVEMMVYRWQAEAEVPTSVVVVETGERIRLPQKPTITFGRLEEHEGTVANDIVLTPRNPAHQAMISRWHFELRYDVNGFTLVALSDQLTEVDGETVRRGDRAKVTIGTVVELAGGVMTLSLEGDEQDDSAKDSSRRTQLWTSPKDD